VTWNWPWTPPPVAATPRIEPTIRLPITISPHLLGISRANRANLGAVLPPASPWGLPEPPPGMLPKGAPTMAQDEAIGSLYGWAGDYGGGMGAMNLYGEGLYFPGYPYLAQLTQRPEYRRGSEIIAKEMTRKWIKLTAKGDADKSETLAKIDAELKRLKAQDTFRRVVEHDGFFGRGQIFLDTGARDELLTTPLIIDKATIKIGGLKRLGVVEPLWTYPAQYDATDPLSQDYYKPRAWYVMGKQVHASRLLTFVGREVPDILKPAYMFGGLSLSQLGKPYVDNWIRTRQSVSDLIHSFSTMVLSTNMGAALTAMPGTGIMDRAALFTNMADNSGLMVVDKETELFANVAAPLGTLDKLLAQSQEQMSSVWGIPLIVFFGITPSGLNTSSEGELAVWNSWIEAQQEDLLDDNLTILIRAVQLSLFGSIDEDIGHAWEPLGKTNELEAATIRKSDADTAIAYIGAGVLAPIEERTRLAAEEDSIYPGLDVEDLPEMPEPPDLGDPNESDPKDTSDGR
jgi:phage-related protein (TIGR01555 family)